MTNPIINLDEWDEVTEKEYMPCLGDYIKTRINSYYRYYIKKNQPKIFENKIKRITVSKLYIEIIDKNDGTISYFESNIPLLIEAVKHWESLQ